jgi:hypothetical protein
MTMEKPKPKKKLTEAAILESRDLVTQIKTAEQGEPMSADDFKAWLASFR